MCKKTRWRPAAHMSGRTQRKRRQPPGRSASPAPQKPFIPPGPCLSASGGGRSGPLLIRGPENSPAEQGALFFGGGPVRYPSTRCISSQPAGPPHNAFGSHRHSGGFLLTKNAADFSSSAASAGARKTGGVLLTPPVFRPVVHLSAPPQFSASLKILVSLRFSIFSYGSAFKAGNPVNVPKNPPRGRILRSFWGGRIQAGYPKCVNPLSPVS